MTVAGVGRTGHSQTSAIGVEIIADPVVWADSAVSFAALKVGSVATAGPAAGANITVISGILAVRAAPVDSVVSREGRKVDNVVLAGPAAGANITIISGTIAGRAARADSVVSFATREVGSVAMVDLAAAAADTTGTSGIVVGPVVRAHSEVSFAARKAGSVASADPAPGVGETTVSSGIIADQVVRVDNVKSSTGRKADRVASADPAVSAAPVELIISAETSVVSKEIKADPATRTDQGANSAARRVIKDRRADRIANMEISTGRRTISTAPADPAVPARIITTTMGIGPALTARAQRRLQPKRTVSRRWKTTTPTKPSLA